MTAKNITPDCPLCQERIAAVATLEAEIARLRAELVEREGDVAWCEDELLRTYCPTLADYKQAG